MDVSSHNLPPEFRCCATSLETSQFSISFHLLPLLQSQVLAESDTVIDSAGHDWGVLFNWPFSFRCGRYPLIPYVFFLFQTSWCFCLVLSLGCSVCLTASVTVHSYYYCLSWSSYSHFRASLSVDGFTSPDPRNVNHGRIEPQWHGARGGASNWGSPRCVTCTILQASRRAVWTYPAKTYREHVHSMQ